MWCYRDNATRTALQSLEELREDLIHPWSTATTAASKWNIISWKKHFENLRSESVHLTFPQSFINSAQLKYHPGLLLLLTLLFQSWHFLPLLQVLVNQLNVKPLIKVTISDPQSFPGGDGGLMGGPQVDSERRFNLLLQSDLIWKFHGETEEHQVELLNHVYIDLSIIKHLSFGI